MATNCWLHREVCGLCREPRFGGQRLCIKHSQSPVPYVLYLISWCWPDDVDTEVEACQKLSELFDQGLLSQVTLVFLHRSIRGCLYKVAELLIKKGAHPGRTYERYTTFLHITVSDTRFFKIMLQSSFAQEVINQQDKYGRTALWLASKAGMCENVKAALQHGADPTITPFRPSDRYEPLHTILRRTRCGDSFYCHNGECGHEEIRVVFQEWFRCYFLSKLHYLVNHRDRQVDVADSDDVLRCTLGMKDDVFQELVGMMRLA